MVLDAASPAVEDEVTRIRPQVARDLRSFRILRTDEEAVTTAALARLPSGKRYPHRGRIPHTSLEASRAVLLANLAALRGCARDGSPESDTVLVLADVDVLAVGLHVPLRGDDPNELVAANASWAKGIEDNDDLLGCSSSWLDRQTTRPSGY